MCIYYIFKSGIYPWSFVTQIFHSVQPCRDCDRKTFNVMTNVHQLKGHNFFQISTFLDSDFSTLISNGNTFQFSQDFCAKSSGKLTFLIPREISIMVINSIFI
jgi:hypothetical protein